MQRTPEVAIQDWYAALAREWGRQHWWPAESAFEVVVGAILTQNTSWTNVEKAIVRLRERNLLSLEGLRAVSTCELEELVRSSGYFRQKTQRLKALVAFVDLHYGGSLESMFASNTDQLRRELLALNGVGPETADSILLYAGGHPVFVVDAYTRRILHRHDVLPFGTPYESIRALFEHALADGHAPQGEFAHARSSAHVPSQISMRVIPHQAQVFNEMHAWIVGIGKRHCLKSAPLCENCPLRPYLPGGGPRELPAK